MNTQDNDSTPDGASFNGFGSYRRKRYGDGERGKGKERSFRRIPRSEFGEGGESAEKAEEGREFGKRPFGKKPFGKKPFGKKPFGKKPFGKKFFGKKDFGERDEEGDGEERRDRSFKHSPRKFEEGGRGRFGGFGKKPRWEGPRELRRPYGAPEAEDGDEAAAELETVDDWSGTEDKGERVERKPFGKKEFWKKPFGKKPFGKKPFGKPFKKPFGRKPVEGEGEGEGDFGGKRPFGKGKPFGKKPFGKKPFGKPFGKKPFGKKPSGGRSFKKD